MADTDSDDTQGDRTEYTEATDENSGASIEGDTPPAEGLGVGPTNPDMDIEKRGERATGKIAIIIILTFVGAFALLWIIGRTMGAL